MLFVLQVPNKIFVFEQIICSVFLLNMNFIPEQIFCSDSTRDKPLLTRTPADWPILVLEGGFTKQKQNQFSIFNTTTTINRLWNEVFFAFIVLNSTNCMS